MGGGATGSVLGGIVDKTTDAIWFKNAETNTDLAALDAAVLDTLQIRNTSKTEYAWKVPTGVTSISIACMGCGGGGVNYGTSSQASTSRGGGELMWRNNISVTAGTTLYVHAAQGSEDGIRGMSSDAAKYISDTSANETAWTDSAVTNYSRASYVRIWDGGVNKWLVVADGASGYNGNDNTNGGNDGLSRMNNSLYGTLGTQGTDYGGGHGGNGGGRQSGGYNAYPRGSGGAGGYTGKGGNGSGSQSGDGTNGQGGGGGGAASYHVSSNYDYQGTPPGYAYGGDTYMWGEGNAGNKGNFTFNRPGEGSKTGTGASNTIPRGLGMGGGGGKDGWINVNAWGPYMDGWVRIVWSKEGVTRTFPSTNILYPG